MAAKIPIVRQIAWISVIPHVLVLLVLVGLTFAFQTPLPLFVEAAVYLVISLTLRLSIPRHHRGGMRHAKKHEFQAAIPEFQASYDFFTRHRWLDDYRCITFLDSSAVSYRELALLNIAFCYGQLGNGEACKAMYYRVVEEFPNSMMAKSSLRMIESLTGEKAEPSSRPESPNG